MIYATIEDGLITVVASNVEGESNYRTIEELQSNLDPETFWRVHRSFLVNINRIKEVIPVVQVQLPAPHGRQEADRNSGQPRADQAAAGVVEVVTSQRSAIISLCKTRPRPSRPICARFRAAIVQLKRYDEGA